MRRENGEKEHFYLTVLLDKNDRHALARKLVSRGQARRAGPDNNHRALPGDGFPRIHAGFFPAGAERPAAAFLRDLHLLWAHIRSLTRAVSAKNTGRRRAVREIL